MKILTYGEILERGNSLFTTVAQVNEERLILNFKGSIRIDNPYEHLSFFIQELETKLKEQQLAAVEMDFTELQYCNSNGFYLLMDIIETVYSLTKGKVVIKRVLEDDWQQETLPILLNLDDELIAARTIVQDKIDI